MFSSLYQGAKVTSEPLSIIVDDPNQPRKARDPQEFQKLKESIARHGQLTPGIATEVDALLQLNEGHGRKLALLELGKTHMDVIRVKKELSEPERLIFALVSNYRRSDLHFLDRAAVCAELLNKHQWTQTRLAQETGDDLTTINKLLSIDAEEESIKQAIRVHHIGFVKAYDLSKLTDPEEKQAQLQRCLGNGSARKSSSSQSVTQKRVVCPLGSGITVTITGQRLSMEDLLLSLEYVLKEARKYKSKGIDVTTLGKLLKDQAKQPGVTP